MKETEFEEFINSLDTKTSSLKLENKDIKTLPANIGKLINLELLNLRKNKLSKLPKEIKNLKNLKTLHLGSNSFEEIPQIVYELESLEYLYLRHNKIKRIDEKIEMLKNLKTISLVSNQIESLPTTIGKLKKLESLYLSKNRIQRLPNEVFELVGVLKTLSLSGNPIKYPPASVVSTANLELIMLYLGKDQYIFNSNLKDDFIYFNLPIPEKIRTAIKQYLVYFNEYVNVAKNKQIHFEIQNIQNGLSIELSQKDDVELINSYLDEYLGFIKKNIEKLEFDIEGEMNENRKDLFMIELKNQIRHLQSSVEIKAVEVKMLNETVDKLYRLLSIQKQQPTQILIRSTSESVSKSSAYVQSEFDLEIEFPNLEKNFLKFRDELLRIEPSYNGEIGKIETALEEIDPSTQDPNSMDKAVFKKLKKIFDEINNEDSALNKGVTASKKALKACQQLGKTYNRFAEWLALPQVPKIFLGE